MNGAEGAEISVEDIGGADGSTGITVGYGSPGAWIAGICLHSDTVGNGIPGIEDRVASCDCWVI